MVIRQNLTAILRDDPEKYGVAKEKGDKTQRDYDNELLSKFNKDVIEEFIKEAN